MTATPTMTREDVVAVLNRIISFGWRGVDKSQVPVHFMGQRISVALPAANFPIDLQINLSGKFQYLMTQQGAHAFIDFVEDWRGLDTKLDTGFN